ncbi:MAG TPA: hypothetical protein DCL13_07010 [Peptococcaceae bacterium]|nr:hypothetical protein [Peptococcaceae bacterium]
MLVPARRPPGSRVLPHAGRRGRPGGAPGDAAGATQARPGPGPRPARALPPPRRLRARPGATRGPARAGKVRRAGPRAAGRPRAGRRHRRHRQAGRPGGDTRAPGGAAARSRQTLRGLKAVAGKGEHGAGKATR